MIYIFIVALFLVLISSGVDVSVSPNVGTVLFTERDAQSRTWTKNKLALLQARLYSQHLIPPFIPPQTPDFVESLLTYFQDCYTTIREESKDADTDQILTTAFTDVVGGYLKTFALPLTKYGYYGGSLPKQDALKLFLFYEDVKNYLGRNDSGWAGPDLSVLNSMTVSVALPPFTFVRRQSHPDPCHYLAYFQKTPEGLVVPTPAVDWNSCTMFIPLANQSLINLHSADVSNALHKYYDVALNCVRSKRPSEIDSFNERFQSWLRGDVMPHLNDDPLYAALEGVLSLINTTNDLAAYTAYKDVMSPKPKQPQPKIYHAVISTKMMIVLAIVAVEVLWCIPTLVCICIRRRKPKSRTLASRINTILETRRNETSDSAESCNLGGDTPKLNFMKRRGGLKIELKPNSPVFVGEVYSRRAMCAAATDTCGRALPRRPDAATMVDEAPRKRSSKDTQTRRGRHVGTVNRVSTLPAKAKETWSKIPSDGTSKTVIISAPSKAATIRLSRRLKEPADASVESCVKDQHPPCFPSSCKQHQSKEDTMPTKESETIVAKASSVAKEMECPSKTANEHEPTSDDVTIIKPLKSNNVAKHVKERSLKSEEKPFLEIRIDKPRREISVDVMRGEDVRKGKKVKKSRIPKSVGTALVAQVGAPSPGWRPPGPGKLSPHKSLIPKLKWATDDTALLRDVGTKAPKLNVTM